MAHTLKTALLNQNTWDLQLDGDGNIKLCTGAQAVAQNAANEIRLWRNDAYFQQNNGIAWKEAQLAKKLDLNVLLQVIREAAMKVPEVAAIDDISVVEFNTETRALHGEITVTTTLGEKATAPF